MNLGNYFAPQNFFDLTPGPWSNYGFYVFIIAAIVFGLGILAKITYYLISLDDVKRRLVDKLSSFFLTVGGLSLFFWVSRQQNIALFSARFWWFLLFISGVIWIYFIIRSIFRFKKNKQEYLQKKKEYFDYLPKKKR